MKFIIVSESNLCCVDVIDRPFMPLSNFSVAAAVGFFETFAAYWVKPNCLLASPLPYVT
jgi:hypothetical protein